MLEKMSTGLHDIHTSTSAVLSKKQLELFRPALFYITVLAQIASLPLPLGFQWALLIVLIIIRKHDTYFEAAGALAPFAPLLERGTCLAIHAGSRVCTRLNLRLRMHGRVVGPNSDR